MLLKDPVYEPKWMRFHPPVTPLGPRTVRLPHSRPTREKRLQACSPSNVAESFLSLRAKLLIITMQEIGQSRDRGARRLGTNLTECFRSTYAVCSI